METFWQDLRFGFRQSLNKPGFTLIAVITLAMGIGANTAIFSLIDAALLKSLPVKDPQQLVVFSIVGIGGSQDTFNYPLIERFNQANRSFTGIIVSNHGERMRMSTAEPGSSQNESVQGEQVSGNYFSVLGVGAVVGRTLSEADDSRSEPQPVAVISHDFWRRRFGADPGVVGRKITLNDFSFVIVGVMPEGFRGTEPGGQTDLWWPIRMKPQVFPGDRSLESRGWWQLQVMARLRPDVNVEQARAEMDVVFRQQLDGVPADVLSKLTPAQRRKHFEQRVELRSGIAGWSRLRREFRRPLLILMTVASLALLIACANVAALQLARAAGRASEIAVRLALGAGRFRLIRQLLTESLLLAATGGALGLLFAYQGTRVLLTYLPREYPVSFDLTPDVRALGFTLAVSALTGVLFGLAPALRSTRPDLTSALKEKNTSGGPGRSRLALNKVLIVTQVALSLFLLIGAGLFARSLQKLKSLDMGFDPENVVIFSVETGNDLSVAQRVDLSKRFLARLEALPGARSASISGWHLLSGAQSNNKITVPGYTPQPDEDTTSYLLRVGPKFFETMGIPLLQGRDFGPQDERQVEASPGQQSAGKTATPAAPVAVVINQAMARYFFGDESPLGKSFYYPGDSLKGIPLQVVGVVKDAKYQTLRETTRRTFYAPYFQKSHSSGQMDFQLRAVGSPAGLGGAIQRAARELNPKLQVVGLRTMNDVVSESLVQERFVAQIAGFFSLFALLLACIGLYGTISYVVTRRASEIGIRMALGANRRDALKLILRQGVMLTLLGVVLGLAGTYALTKYLESRINLKDMLYGVEVHDPLTYSVIAVLLTLVALVACFIPARRATKVDPMIALRCD
jgi:predicted permease